MTLSNTILRPLRKGIGPLAFALGLGLAAPLPAAPTASAQPNAEEGERGQRGDRAHRGHRGHRGQGHGLRAMLRQLDLSENQRTQVRAIMESARTRRAEIGAMPAGPERVAARQALRQETRRLTMEVLTPAQRRQAEALKREHVQNRVSARVDRMTERLGLDAAQARQVEALFLREARARMSARESGEGPPDRAAREARRDAMRGQLARILTPEQLEQLEAHRAHRGERRGERRGGQRGR
ncbi:MAG: hypothetical protein AAF447_08320 [Myxococcota bacterium]